MTAHLNNMQQPIWKRKRDLVYLVFFLIHIPVMLCVDLVGLYPGFLQLSFMRTIRTFYIKTYHDRFFTEPPAWFSMYMWMEALYHLPLSLWVIPALIRGDPKVPIHLLIYAMQTAITTSTCIADYLSWPGYSTAEKLELGKLYVPYLALSVFMGVDMYSRLDTVIAKQLNKPAKKKM